MGVTETTCISREKIRSILAEANSPAKDYYNDFYDLGQQYGIDPEIALAFFRNESGYGTQGVAVQTLSVGNIIYSPTCPGSLYTSSGSQWCRYDNWNQSINDWYRLISSNTYVGQGLDTVEEIVPKYAPSSENDVEQYIANVRTFVKDYREA